MKHLRLLWVALATMLGLSANAQTLTGDQLAAGDFFLYNVGAQKYLSAGDPAAHWGTNAWLTEQATLDWTLAEYNGGYSLNSHHSNGGSSQFMGSNFWVDGGQTAWTFTATGDDDNSYLLSCGADGYMIANSASTDVEMSTSANGDNAKWLLLSKATLIAYIANATEDNPMDATFFIHGSTFNRNDQDCIHRSTDISNPGPFWNCDRSGGNYTIAGPDEDRETYGCELWNSTFTFSQTLTDLPAGKYELTVQGFGTNGTTYIFAGNTEKNFANTTNSGNFRTVLDAIRDGEYTGNTTGQFNFGGGNLEIGLKRPSQVGQDWTVFDNFRLTYYGQLDLSEFAEQLVAAVEAAEALQGTIPSSAYETLAAVVEEYNKEYTTAEDYQTAIAAITEATEAAKALQTEYGRYVYIKEKVLAVSSTIDTSDADAQANAAISGEDIEAAISTLRSALGSYLPTAEIAEGEYIDITDAMIDNPTVSKNVDFWNVDNLVRAETWGTGPTTNYGETEFYQSTFDFNQVVNYLPKGTYEFGVQGFHRAGTYATYFYAGEDKILLPGETSDVVNSMADAKTYFDNGNGYVSLKFALENETNSIKMGIVNNDTQTDRWTIFRNFTLHYYGTLIDLTPYQEAWAAAVAAADKAITDYPNVTGDELTALNTAKADEPEENIPSYQEKTGALQDATAAFIAAAPSYDAYYAEKAIAEMIGVTVGAAPTTAAGAAEGVNNLKVAEFNYVAQEYPYDYELVVGTFDTWEGTATVAGQPGTPNHLNDQHWSGEPHDYYEQDATGWGNANGWTIQYQKTVTLPAGDYMLKVSARSSAEVTSSVTCTATTNTVSLPSAGNATKGIDKSGNANFGEGDFVNDGNGYGWEWRFLPFSLDDETEVTMTFYGETDKQYQWMSISDGTLLSKQEVNLYATQDDYDELNTALADFENLILGFDEDEYAPYNNVPFIEAYEAAIAIDQEIDNLRTDVRAAIDALSDVSVIANTEEVNAVYDGDFSLEEAHESGENVVLPGWTTVSGNTRFILKNTETYPALTDAEAQAALFVHPGTYEYGRTTGYTMPLDAGEMYVLTFKYCSWQSGNNEDFTATILDEEGNVVASKSYGKVQGGLGDEGALKAVKLYFTPEADGNYILSLNANGNSAFTDVKIVKAEVTVLDLSSTDTEAPEEQFAGTVTTDRKLLEGLNTLVLPFETTKEEIGATTVLEYTGTSVEENGLTLNFREVEGTLMANVPYAVLLDNDADDDLSFTNKEVTPSEDLTVVDAGHEFDFVGTYVDIPKGNDIIVAGDYVAGADAFKKAKGGNRLAAYRAYLKRLEDAPDEPTNVAFNFDGYIVEGIEAVELLNSLSGDIYNLNGQKVNRTQRGIYIINGQKVVVK